MTTYLDIINQVDSFKDPSPYYILLDHEGKTELGYITPEIANLFKLESSFIVKDKLIQIDPQYDTIDKRNKLFEEIANKWRKLPELDELLNKGWRNELYIVYNPSTKPYVLIERAFSVLLGVVTYGVHINGYIPAELSSNGKIKLWIPKRSMTKPTYPGMLDNTVAGGLGYPHGLETTVIKECFEEAGLNEQFVKKNIKNVGVVSYMYLTKDKRVQPEVEYIYDLEFKEKDSILIQPQDGEAEDFKLMDIDEVLAELKNKKFKPNCGLIIIDFLIRHGLINAENESNYLEIVSRCHVKMPFPTR
ncbi:hypothetical protein KGF54_001219 [Candida jiufengensis]|uniref:uncharacterized protein n=1 Tax=Candida jiufengensis TaxID=497108 RepID=UPI00222465CB|nr:uncharacterized protein KGF54_001219 [Candida jiufengensis]KAI5955717.1 hypothetical protein KGF54_001219 [Candida jiufengensis]